MSRQGLTRLGFLASVLAAVALSGCIAARRDFPSWRFIEPQWVSDQLTTGQEDMPDVAVNRFGQAVVVWSHATSGSATAEIYWRRYDSLGRAAFRRCASPTNAMATSRRVSTSSAPATSSGRPMKTRARTSGERALDSQRNVTRRASHDLRRSSERQQAAHITATSRHVIWIGSTASMGDTIYARIANNGTPTLVPHGHHADQRRARRGRRDQRQLRPPLHIAFVCEKPAPPATT
jgi:hypothetical protein